MKGTTNAQRNAVVGSSSAVDKLTLTMADGTTQQHTVSDMIPKDTEPTTGSAKFVTSGVVKAALDEKVDKVDGKGLSTNDYTTTEKNKLAGISTGAQVNVIEEVQLNGAKITPSSKAVNIDLSSYATKGDLSSIPKFAISVVTELPASGISTSTIYLKSNGGSSGNSYDEYLYVNGAWEKIGTTEVDLSGYVPKTTTVNNKQLNANITLTAGDVGALPANGTAVKATADANGNNIVNTYATQTALTNGLAAKQNALTFDSAPTSGSSNPVTSGGVFSAINGVSEAIGGKQDALTFDNTPTSGSSNPVTSGGMYTAIANKMDKVTSIGSSSKPIYINSSGVPTACSYSIGAAASYGVTTSVTSGSSSLVTSGAVYTAINNNSASSFDTVYTGTLASLFTVQSSDTITLDRAIRIVIYYMEKDYRYPLVHSITLYPTTFKSGIRLGARFEIYTASVYWALTLPDHFDSRNGSGKIVYIVVVVMLNNYDEIISADVYADGTPAIEYRFHLDKVDTPPDVPYSDSLLKYMIYI